MNSNPHFVDIAGAPFKIGEHVRVVNRADQTLEEELLGRVGVVEYFEYD